MHGNGIALGPGLLSGKAKVFNEFIVHTNIDQESGISIGIEGPSNATMRYIDNEDGSIKVSYKPQSGGYYKITVKQNGLHVKGSPFEVPVYDNETDLEPFLPKSSFNSHQQQQKHQHHHQEPTEDCLEGPFGSASRVKVSGRGLFRGITNVQSEIIVDTRKAGLGRVAWTMTGPGNVQTRHVNIVSGLHKLYYTADTRGLYVVRIKFNEQDVPGSPFKLRIM